MLERLFDKTNPRKKRKITHFDDEIMINLGGKNQNIRKLIATNAEGTGIYEQIEMYGLNPIQPIEISEFIQDYTDLTGDLRSVIERGQIAKQMFKNLPIEIRNQFNNDEDLFMRTGEDWINQQKQIIEQEKQKLKGDEDVKE